MRPHGPPELALHDVAKVLDELNRDGAIQPELPADSGQFFRSSVRSGHQSGRISGDNSHGHEDRRENPKEDREKEDEPTDNQSPHVLRHLQEP